MNKYKIYVNINVKTCIKVLMKQNIINRYRTQEPHEKQPKCPLTDERMKKMQHMHTIKLQSQKETMLSAARTQMETAILSEVSQKERDKYHTTALMWN